MIASCTCKNEYMDRAYGQGQRVFNTGGKDTHGRCASCRAEKKFADAPRDKGKKR